MSKGKAKAWKSEVTGTIFAVVRLARADSSGKLRESPWAYATLVKAYWSEGAAQAEAKRLNANIETLKEARDGFEIPADDWAFYTVIDGHVIGSPNQGEHDSADDLSPEQAAAKFRRIVSLDDRAIQRVLMSVERHDLVTALADSPSDVQDRFLANVSKRAAAMMRDDFEILEIEDDEPTLARRRIVGIVRRIEEYRPFRIPDPGSDIDWINDDTGVVVDPDSRASAWSLGIHDGARTPRLVLYDERLEDFLPNLPFQPFG